MFRGTRVVLVSASPGACGGRRALVQFRGQSRQSADRWLEKLQYRIHQSPILLLSEAKWPAIAEVQQQAASRLP